MSFLQALQDEFARFSCDLALSNDLFSNITRNVAFGFNQEAIARYKANQKLLWCNEPPFNNPFRPGECPIRYDVTINYRITGNPTAALNETFTAGRNFAGPIGAASYRIIEADGPGMRQIVRITLAAHSTLGGPRLDNWLIYEFPNGEFHEMATLVILGVSSVPSGGQTITTCGEYIDPTPYNPDAHTYRRPVTYTTNNNVSVTVPLVFIVNQFKVDADLNLKVPINVKIDPVVNFKTTIPIDINAEFDWSTGDTKIDWVGGDGAEPSPLPPAAPAPPPGTSPNDPPPSVPPEVPEPEPDPTDPDDGRVIVGAIVTSTLTGNENGQTIIFQSDNPNIYAPSLGYINFGSRRDIGGFGWTADIAIKNLRQYIPCPIPEGAGSVEGTPKGGVSWVITPVYSNSDRSSGGP